MLVTHFRILFNVILRLEFVYPMRTHTTRVLSDVILRIDFREFSPINVVNLILGTLPITTVEFRVVVTASFATFFFLHIAQLDVYPVYRCVAREKS